MLIALQSCVVLLSHYAALSFGVVYFWCYLSLFVYYCELALTFQTFFDLERKEVARGWPFCRSWIWKQTKFVLACELMRKEITAVLQNGLNRMQTTKWVNIQECHFNKRLHIRLFDYLQESSFWFENRKTEMSKGYIIIQGMLTVAEGFWELLEFLHHWTNLRSERHNIQWHSPVAWSHIFVTLHKEYVPFPNALPGVQRPHGNALFPFLDEGRILQYFCQPGLPWVHSVTSVCPLFMCFSIHISLIY